MTMTTSPIGVERPLSTNEQQPARAKRGPAKNPSLMATLQVLDRSTNINAAKLDLVRKAMVSFQSYREPEDGHVAAAMAHLKAYWGPNKRALTSPAVGFHAREHAELDRRIEHVLVAAGLREGTVYTPDGW